MSILNLINILKYLSRAPDTISDPLEELVKLSSSTEVVERYEYLQTGNQRDREHHKYLIHVTSLDSARNIIRSGKIFGLLTCATFAQNIIQCIRQSKSDGCALIFEWQSTSYAGYLPTKLELDVAYHHLEYGGVYIETFIAHGSPTPLKLIAIAVNSDPEPYRIARILESPISIKVQK
jgi:hypothetical protein